MQPRLIALVEASEIVVIAVVEEMQTATQGYLETTARAEKVLLGPAPSQVMRFRTRTRLRPGGRYVLFLRATQALEAITLPGEVFEADANDDALLSRLVAELLVAAKSSSHERTRRQCQSLVPAVSARSEAIRYQAALELDHLAGPMTLTAEEHEQLAKAALVDPVIEPILSNILRRQPRPTPPGP